MANLAQDIAKQSGTGSVYSGPLFSEVLPFYKAWETLLPQVKNEAYSQINPFIQRDLKNNVRDYTYNVLAGGGNRFGRAIGQLGKFRANAQRDLTSQTQDWVNSRQQGFQSLFYDPAAQAWERAMMLGQKPTAPKIPTWGQFSNQFNNSYPTS